MRHYLAAGLVAGLVLPAPAWSQTSAPLAEPAAPTAAYDADTVVATVNGTEITLGHVLAMGGRLPAQYQNLPDEMLLSGIIDQLVDQTLLAETAGDLAEQDRFIRLLIENERRAIVAGRLIEQRMTAPVDEAAVQAAYDAAVAGFQSGPEFNASHILVETEERANELRAEIEGGAAFSDVASANSQDNSAVDGGNLGWFGLGRMVPEFEAAVVGMEVGELAGPLETQFGWHLIRLEDTRESAPPPLEEVRADIENQVRQETIQAELDALRVEASIDRPEGVVPPSAIRETDLLED